RSDCRKGRRESDGRRRFPERRGGHESGGPGEGRRQTGLALVLDAERVDVRPRRLGGREFRTDRMEDAGELRRLAGLDTEWDDVLDLEVDHLADLRAVGKPVLVHLERDA